jgi:type II secretory pathway pseudopilin PulG
MRDAIPKGRRGFTVVELCVVVLVVGALCAALFVLLSGDRRQQRVVKDGTQIRGIHQGLVMLASSMDSYARPSMFDTMGAAVSGPQESKDTTSNVISLLIFSGFFKPDICVSPSETNPAIRIDTKYEYANPKGAVLPAQAHWDPGFSADFTAVNPARPAGFSYAHLLPFGKRGELKWNNSFNSNDAIISNRGPKVSSATFGKAPFVVPTFDLKSNTLLIHGGRSTWEGNVVYNDNSLVFETSMASAGKLRSYFNVGPSKMRGQWDDLLFYEEPEDTEHTDNFLVNVNKIGENGPELIWD